MKKTVYFTSANTGIQQLETAINDAVAKKDAFLVENKNDIVKIDNEDLKITQWQNAYVFATILLTYYTK